MPETNNTQESFKLATAQRQRSILLYDAFCRPSSSSSSSIHVKLYDSKPSLLASKLCAIDSSESKFAISGLETAWGVHKGTVCIRGSDIAYIDLEIKS